MCRWKHWNTHVNIISFYTTISHEFGLEAIDYFLTKTQEDLHPRFKTNFFLESTDFILKNNMLTFDSEFYLQITRTANLTMGYHEIKVYSIIHQNSCFRFLEDCQILLKVNLIKPDHLLSILNQTNNIQFTMKKSQTRLF